MVAVKYFYKNLILPIDISFPKCYNMPVRKREGKLLKTKEITVMKIRISFIQILALILYAFWALGDPNITVWHWLIPFLLDTVDSMLTPFKYKK